MLRVFVWLLLHPLGIKVYVNRNEFVPRTLMNYMEKDFRNLATDDLDLNSEEEKKAQRPPPRSGRTGWTS